MSNESNIPYNELELTIRIIDRHRRFMRARAQRENPQIASYDSAVEFLERLKKLYFECAGCGRIVAPDEKQYTDPATELRYCMKCLEEGI